MLLLELGSELPNIIKRFQSVLKIWTKYRLNFNKVECTGGNHPVGNCQGRIFLGGNCLRALPNLSAYESILLPCYLLTKNQREFSRCLNTPTKSCFSLLQFL